MSVPQPLGGASVKYSQQYRRCGRPGCPSCTPPGRGHGPYWYAYWWEEGRVRSRYLGKQLPSVEPALQAVPAPAPAGTLRVRTLGGFAVWRAGELMPAGHWGRRKVAALFKCLLSAPGYQLHREQLIDMLFPDADPSEAAKSFRSTVYLLRKVLDSPDAPVSHVQSRGDLLVLVPAVTGEPAADWLDAAAFAQAAVAALAGRDVARCRTVLSLYGGEYLPEDRYEEWAERRREELRGQHLALLLHLADLGVAEREVEEALRCLRTVLTADPCHEDAARYLMELLAREGRLSEALEVYRALATALEEELGVSPARETRAVRARLLAQAPVALVPPTRRTNLPAPLTSFIGREWERAELTRFLREGVGGSRLLTLVGAGGCGKTRLALEVARGLLDDYPDGVYLVELAPLADPGLLHQAVAGALGLRETQQAADQSVLDMVATYISGRQLLLVLDNCEHLVAGAAELAVALLQAAPGLRILVTSQAALGVLGELAWRVPSLSLPEGSDLPVADLAPYEAVQLFVERAQLTKPHFALTERNAAAVLQVCRRLDGIPLALELAAARLGVLAVEQLAGRLDDRLGLLTEGNRTALPRQQTLRATIEWSYNLLTATERVLLGRLSVFVGGWTLEAAEGVCVGPKLSRHAVLERLDGLVSKSLVQVNEREGAMRYRLLETVRAYAQEQLIAAGEQDAVHHRHLTWFVELAERAEPKLRGSEQGAWMTQLEREHDNFRAALRWAQGVGEQEWALRLAGALWWFWNMRGHQNEGRRWLEGLLDGADEVDGPVLAKALQGASTLAYVQDDFGQAIRLGERNMALCNEVGDLRGVAFSLHMFGMVARSQGKLEQAVRPYEQALALYREVGDSRGTAMALQNLGTAFYDQGYYARTADCYEEALALRRQLHDQGGTAAVLSSLAAVQYMRGQLASARQLFEECLDIFMVLETNKLHTAAMLYNLGTIAFEQGDLAEARSKLEQGLQLARELGSRQLMTEALCELSRIARTSGDHTQAADLLHQSLELCDELGDAQLRSFIYYEQSMQARGRGNLQVALAFGTRGLTNCGPDAEWRVVVQGLETVASVLVALERLEEATRLYGAAAAVRERQNTPLLPSARQIYDSDLEVLRGRLDAAFAAEWAAGGALTLQDAVTEATSASQHGS